MSVSSARITAPGCSGFDGMTQAASASLTSPGVLECGSPVSM